MLKDLFSNPLILTDTYNLSHQFLKFNNDWEVSHVYNRKRPMVLYGVSEAVNRVLSIKIEMWMVDEAEQYAKEKSMPFPRELWERVVNEFNGYAPIMIESLPEGSYIPAGTPFMQIRNTVEGFGELKDWWEGIILQNAFASGCATRAYEMAKYLKDNDLPMIRFHSFGWRGHQCPESGYWAGTAWNLFLVGTDDFHTKKHTPKAKIGSIPALAHKVTQQFDKEYDCYIRAIDFAVNTPLRTVALVIDTYDANRFINQYLIGLARYALDKGVHIVCRPDSGDVLDQAIEIYKVCIENNLANVSVIIGEGITFEVVKAYDAKLKDAGVPLAFVSYGIGAGFYKDIDRDYLGFAMKVAFSNGKPRMKFGMTALKRSIPGKVSIIKKDGDLLVIPEGSLMSYTYNDLYEIIYVHDDTTEEPIIKTTEWNEIYDRVQEVDDHQKVIYISQEIENMIAEFKEQYKG